MRWMWIDRIVSLEPGRRAVTTKNVSYAEEHIHQHFEAAGDLPALPVMPGALIIEGVAQTGGILVGHASSFAEKVVLAKITRAELHADATPGCTLKYEVEITQWSSQGAATVGTVLLRTAEGTEFTPIGRVDLVFSHLDRNLGGAEYPEHNFVFSETFRDILRLSGIDPDALVPVEMERVFPRG